MVRCLATKELWLDFDCKLTLTEILHHKTRCQESELITKNLSKNYQTPPRTSQEPCKSTTVPTHLLTFTRHNLQNESQPEESQMRGRRCLRRMASSIDNKIQITIYTIEYRIKYTNKYRSVHSYGPSDVQCAPHVALTAFQRAAVNATWQNPACKHTDAKSNSLGLRPNGVSDLAPDVFYHRFIDFFDNWPPNLGPQILHLESCSYHAHSFSMCCLGVKYEHLLQYIFPYSTEIMTSLGP